MIKKHDGIAYIQAFPDLQKWMCTCICCGATGYQPDMPDTLTRNLDNGEFVTVSARTIHQYFKPLAVNEISICETCQKLMNDN